MYARLELRQLQQAIRDLVDGLPERERKLIHSHYFQQVPLRHGAGDGTHQGAHCKFTARRLACCANSPAIENLLTTPVEAARLHDTGQHMTSNPSTSAQHAERLTRLEQFLQDDPDNPSLVSEAAGGLRCRRDGLIVRRQS